jgi:D-glycero-alpha-D-manno-heptose-7-phosphate kinase
MGQGRSDIMIKRINSAAPIRICDIGGWTDTWFAGHGAVFNIAVYPCAEVQIEIHDRRTSEERVVINVENFGDTYAINPNKITYAKHPLIEAAIDVMKIPDDMSLTISVCSAAPPGASTGTSAAVLVALIGGLAALTNRKLTPHEVAAMAHSVETEKLRLQSGIQDQLCSAYGGVNYIEMHRFPEAEVSPIRIPNALWWELEDRLAVVYIGAPHSSSSIHTMVIKDLGENAENDARMVELRRLAAQAKEAVCGGDFELLGKTMNANTEVQRSLHKDLVCPKFDEIMGIARRYNALGCKVNGAGGDGGSLTILTGGSASTKRKMLDAIRHSGYEVLWINLSQYGLRVW